MLYIKLSQFLDLGWYHFGTDFIDSVWFHVYAYVCVYMQLVHGYAPAHAYRHANVQICIYIPRRLFVFHFKSLLGCWLFIECDF